MYFQRRHLTGSGETVESGVLKSDAVIELRLSHGSFRKVLLMMIKNFLISTVAAGSTWSSSGFYHMERE
jgi:hypothetical protein